MNNPLQDCKLWYSMLLRQPFSLYLSPYQQHWYSHLTSSLQFPPGHSVTPFHPYWTSILFLQLLFHHNKNEVRGHHSKACPYLPYFCPPSHFFFTDAHATYKLQFSISLYILVSVLQILSDFLQHVVCQISCHWFHQWSFKYSGFSF